MSHGIDQEPFGGVDATTQRLFQELELKTLESCVECGGSGICFGEAMTRWELTGRNVVAMHTGESTRDGDDLLRVVRICRCVRAVREVRS